MYRKENSFWDGCSCMSPPILNWDSTILWGIIHQPTEAGGTVLGLLPCSCSGNHSCSTSQSEGRDSTILYRRFIQTSQMLLTTLLSQWITNIKQFYHEFHSESLHICDYQSEILLKDLTLSQHLWLANQWLTVELCGSNLSLVVMCERYLPKSYIHVYTIFLPSHIYVYSTRTYAYHVLDLDNYHFL